MDLPDNIHADDVGEFYIDLPNSSYAGDECIELWPQFFLVRSLWMYGGCAILALGSIGHPLTIVVVLGDAGMRRMPLTVYLVAMSLAGIVALCSDLLPVVVDYWSCYRIALKNLTSEAGCRVLSGVAHWSVQFYSWTEVLFAAERLIATRWPMRYNALCSWRRNLGIVCAFAFALAALNAFHFFTHGYNEFGFCEPINLYLYNSVWSHVHLVISALAPIAAMVILNVATVLAIRSSIVSASASTNCAKKRAESATAVMLALNGLFVATSLPELVVEWKEMTPTEFDHLELAGVACRLVKHAGFACVVFVYVCIGAKFRQALRTLFCVCCVRIRLRTVAGRSGGGGGGGGEGIRGSQLPSELTGSTTTSIFVIEDTVVRP